MYRIAYKKDLNEQVTLMKVEAPLIAKKARAGQFIIFRIDEYGERVPLTIADTDPEAGTATIIFQKVGLSTNLLGNLEAGDSILDFVGPLGTATDLSGIRKAAVIGGGVGCAIAYPTAKALYQAGAEVDMIAGFRNEELVIIQEEMEAASSRFFLCTDDGSAGRKGFVTDQLRELLEQGEQYDAVFAIGLVPMMKFVSLLTKEWGVRTIVSLNPIMIDGTGMCGGCRVTVGGQVKFACVDGPDFDGHQVDFDEVIARNATYREFEARRKQDHLCRLGGGAMNG